MDYKSLMGYNDKKKKESKPKQNKVLESIKDEFNINEGPAFEYKKHAKKIDKSLKDLQKNYLDFYEVLRKKGLAKASKKSSREANEGAVGFFENKNIAVLIKVNSETDFAAKSDKFLKLLQKEALI